MWFIVNEQIESDHSGTVEFTVRWDPEGVLTPPNWPRYWIDLYLPDASGGLGDMSALPDNWEPT